MGFQRLLATKYFHPSIIKKSNCFSYYTLPSSHSTSTMTMQPRPHQLRSRTIFYIGMITLCVTNVHSLSPSKFIFISFATYHCHSFFSFFSWFCHTSNIRHILNPFSPLPFVLFFKVGAKTEVRPTVWTNPSFHLKRQARPMSRKLLFQHSLYFTL